MIYDFVILFLPIIIVIFTIINIIISIWIFVDARKRGIVGGIYYCVLEIFLPLVGILLYLVNIKKI